MSQQVQDPLGTVLLPLFQHVGPSGQAFLLPNGRHYGRSEGERGTKWNDFGESGGSQMMQRLVDIVRSLIFIPNAVGPSKRVMI